MQQRVLQLQKVAGEKQKGADIAGAELRKARRKQARLQHRLGASRADLS